MDGSVYRCGKTVVCMTVCTGVGKRPYVWQCVQVRGNCCMHDIMCRCGETAVFTTVCTGVGIWLYVCMYGSK